MTGARFWLRSSPRSGVPAGSPRHCSLRFRAEPHTAIVVVNSPGSDAVILIAIGMKLAPSYSGGAEYRVTLPSRVGPTAEHLRQQEQLLQASRPG